MLNQRLSVEKLKAWESLQLGAMIHYGLPTFTGWEQDPFSPSSSVYDPYSLDVDQWLDGFAELGLRYAILTAKHNSGFCLWPSEFTDYHVGNCGNDTRDVVGMFVDACRKRDILPALYYNLGKDYKFYGDDGHRDDYVNFVCEKAGTDEFRPPIQQEHVTEAYIEYVKNQVAELLTNYGPIFEVWYDSPPTTGLRNGVARIYEHTSQLSPDTFILMNHAFNDGTKLSKGSWPTDLMCGEQTTPPEGGRSSGLELDGKTYYVPMETDCTVGNCWFFKFGHRGRIRSVEDLADKYRRTIGKGANLVWNFGPDRRGRIPQVEFDRIKEVYREVRH